MLCDLLPIQLASQYFLIPTFLKHHIRRSSGERNIIWKLQNRPQMSMGRHPNCKRSEVNPISDLITAGCAAFSHLCGVRERSEFTHFVEHSEKQQNVENATAAKKQIGNKHRFFSFSKTGIFFPVGVIIENWGIPFSLKNVKIMSQSY